MRLLLHSVLILSAACLTGCGGSNGGSTTAPPAGETGPTAMVRMSPAAVMPNMTVTAMVTFSADVIGINAGDFAVSGGTANTFTAVDGHTYMLAITAGGAGTTTVDVDLATGAGQDATGHPTHAAGGRAAVAYAPWANASGSDSFGVWADLTVTGNGQTVVQRFRLIAPGTFTMGSPENELAREEYGTKETPHLVTLTEPYWIADTVCTQRTWTAVMGANPSFHTAGGLDLLVESVSWNDVATFISTVNLACINLNASLPTEAEWEYAARAGTTGPFSLSAVNTDSINCGFSADPSIVDPYISTGLNRGQTVAVCSLPANPWGLYEVHGNVAEWCSDWLQIDLGTAAVIDPIGPSSGTYRVIRGGDCHSMAQFLRSAVRLEGDPNLGGGGDVLGFRLIAPGWPSGPG